MTTQLQIHTNQIPTFEFTDHGSFQVVRLIVNTSKGEETSITVFLPKGSTHGDLLKSLADATIQAHEVPKSYTPKGSSIMTDKVAV